MKYEGTVVEEGIEEIVRHWNVNLASQQNIVISHSLLGHSGGDSVWAGFGTNFVSSNFVDESHSAI